MVVDDPSRMPPPPVAATRRPDRRIRWVARRPPEAMPAPRMRRDTQTVDTPRYLQIPQWGLIDEVIDEPETDGDRVAGWAASLTPMLVTLATLLAVAAVAQAWVYGLLVVNRTEPVNGTLVNWSYAITWGLGVVSMAMVVACTGAFIAWLWHQRDLAYTAIDRVDPRPVWHLVVGCGVPVVNLVAPAVFIHELVRCGHPSPAGRLVRTLRLWWVSWVALNVFAAVTLSIRFTSDSIQWGANAVLLTVFCDLAGAAFAFTATRLHHRVADPAARSEPAIRWLAA